MGKIKFFIAASSALLLASLVVNGVLIYTVYKTQKVIEQTQKSDRIMWFRNMFAEQVLLATKEVDFETRLALETSVRGLNDPEIFAGWQKFTGSETKEEATLAAKNLLKLLIKRTSQ